MSAIDPTDTFTTEARELLAELEASLLTLERQPAEFELIHKIFRALHTLKGSGAMFGPPALAAFAHHVETAFEPVRSAGREASPALVSLLLDCVDHLRQLLEDPAGAHDERTARLAAALRDLGGDAPVAIAAATATAPAASATAAAARWRISFRPGSNAFRFGVNVLGLLDELRAMGPCTVELDASGVPALAELEPATCYLAWDIELETGEPRSAIEDVFIFVADDCELAIEPVAAEVPVAASAPTAVEAAPPALAPAPLPLPVKARVAAGGGKPAEVAAEPGKQLEQESVRVAASRLDALMDQVGELVIAQARLSQLAYARRDPALSSVAEEIERLASELRDSTMGMRMLQVGTLFGRYRRVVRDLARELGKEIELVTTGEETELDKTVIERLGDPLIHLVRNSCDHGLEDGARRIAAGKPATGTIRLEARQAGAEVLISIVDDGAGLDRERIRERAVSRGIIAEGAQLGEREIDQLVFAPGFSTAESVTSLSGRGVGMDVVKRTIEALRGTVEITSAPGEGTTITLRLPLTLAIIDGLLVRVGGATFVVPLAAVEECVELGQAERQGSSGRSFLDIRGALVPFLRLHQVFATDGSAAEPMVVIVASEHGRVGLVVDQVIGQHQTVIKSLSRLHRGIVGLSGATIMGDGRVALIIDVPALINWALELDQERLSA